MFQAQRSPEYVTRYDEESVSLRLHLPVFTRLAAAPRLLMLVE